MRTTLLSHPLPKGGIRRCCSTLAKQGFWGWGDYPSDETETFVNEGLPGRGEQVFGFISNPRSKRGVEMKPQDTLQSQGRVQNVFQGCANLGTLPLGDKPLFLPAILTELPTSVATGLAILASTSQVE
ncbi:hypothetical protein RRG08_057365 [Elysia crispata]|uniref:Uncharacterized protein n=1 Tax=Elysia crispata TaxID=231223 RepID=A0AAE1D0F5_9GAST|nr:hypothetical protein RRG08_057365 [Elysia crispata]